MFHGVYTAIITPFKSGKVDEKKLEELVDFQVNSGVQGVVPCGTTGESFYLTSAEQKRMIEICVAVCKGKALVLPGTGAISTEETIALTQAAKNAGADGAVIITPWYIKPSQESLYQHFKKVSETVDLPLILYNNPTRTGIEMSVETILRLAELKNIQGLKDASSCFQRTSIFKKQLGNGFGLLAGNDDNLGAYLGMGGDGVISMTSNVAPGHFVQLVRAWAENNLAAFKNSWKELFPLISALSLETNPTTIKYAMHLVHGVSLEYRLPFVTLNPSTKEAIEKALQALGLWESLRSVREK